MAWPIFSSCRDGHRPDLRRREGGSARSVIRQKELVPLTLTDYLIWDSSSVRGEDKSKIARGEISWYPGKAKEKVQIGVVTAGYGRAIRT